MSSDPWVPEDELVYAMRRQAEAMERLTSVIERYLDFALGTAVRAMRTAGQDLPPELAGIADDLGKWKSRP